MVRGKLPIDLKNSERQLKLYVPRLGTRLSLQCVLTISFPLALSSDMPGTCLRVTERRTVAFDIKDTSQCTTGL